MAGSSSLPFSWSREMSTVALHFVLKGSRWGEDDPFEEDMLHIAVSKIREWRPPSSESQPRDTSSLNLVTFDHLKAHLQWWRDRYFRICELADHPSALGFDSTHHRVLMQQDQYAQHIQSFPEDDELLNKDIWGFSAMFMLFGRSTGGMPGSRRRNMARARRGRRRGSTGAAESSRGRTTNTDDAEDDDDFVRPLPRRSSTATRGRSTSTTAGRSSNLARGRSTNTDDAEDDDDFVRPLPRRSSTATRGRSTSTTAGRSSNLARGRSTRTDGGLPPNHTNYDDDDDFMPQRPRTQRPRSPPNPDDDIVLTPLVDPTVLPPLEPYDSYWWYYSSKFYRQPWP